MTPVGTTVNDLATLSHVRVLGVRVDVVTEAGFLALVGRWAGERTPRQVVTINRWVRRWHQRPAPGHCRGGRGTPPESRETPGSGRHRAAANFHQRADRGEAVAHDEPPRDAIPQGPLDGIGKPSGGSRQVGGEAGSPLAKYVDRFARGAIDRRHSLVAGSARRCE